MEISGNISFPLPSLPLYLERKNKIKGFKVSHGPTKGLNLKFAAYTSTYKNQNQINKIEGYCMKD